MSIEIIFLIIFSIGMLISLHLINVLNLENHLYWLGLSYINYIIACLATGIEKDSKYLLLPYLLITSLIMPFVYNKLQLLIIDTDNL
jgi:hypothetical protein